jgi:hypothetical protein
LFDEIGHALSFLPLHLGRDRQTQRVDLDETSGVVLVASLRRAGPIVAICGC